MHTASRENDMTSKKNMVQCGCCDALIDQAKAKEAELSVSGRWYVPGAMPETEESQGIFDVGATCYKKKVKAK